MSSDKEHLADSDGPFKEGDSIEKLQRLALQAAADGYKVDDRMYISIPVDESLSYWGTGIWHFTDDGRMVRANVLFSEILSAAVESDVVVNGYFSKTDVKTGLSECAITATVRAPQNIAPHTP